MLKLAVVVLAVALAGTASAEGWRSLRIDGSSEAAFAESLAAFKEKLPRVRAHVFEAALQDIWVQGATIADADQREYTAGDYFRQVDGLGYKEVVTFMDPTGDTAKMRFKAVYANLYGNRYEPIKPWANMNVGTPPPIGWHGYRVRGGTQADFGPNPPGLSGLP